MSTDRTEMVHVSIVVDAPTWQCKVSVLPLVVVVKADGKPMTLAYLSRADIHALGVLARDAMATGALYGRADEVLPYIIDAACDAALAVRDKGTADERVRSLAWCVDRAFRQEIPVAVRADGVTLLGDGA